MCDLPLLTCDLPSTTSKGVLRRLLSRMACLHARGRRFTLYGAPPSPAHAWFTGQLRFVSPRRWQQASETMSGTCAHSTLAWHHVVSCHGAPLPAPLTSCARLATLQDYLAGGTKGGMWRPQRMPKENVAFYQWGYNQACNHSESAVCPANACPRCCTRFLP